MTNQTMELLERVLQVQDDNSVILLSASEVVDALHRFRVTGRPKDEEELIEAAEAFLRGVEA